MIDIVHRYTKAILYHSETAQTIADAVADALKNGASLCGADLPVGYRIAAICFGGWGVTVWPTKTQIGCERHPNKPWLAWTADAPEIEAMHPDAAAWWARHREAVCAVIRDVMQP